MQLFVKDCCLIYRRANLLKDFPISMGKRQKLTAARVGRKVQQHTRKRTEQELRLWEITAPKQSTSNRKNQLRTNHNQSNRPKQSIRRRRARRRRVLFYRCMAIIILILFLAGIYQLTGLVYRSVRTWKQGKEVSTLWQNITQEDVRDNPIEKPNITVNLLEQNRYSRPGTSLKKVKNIFVHYTANPGTSAEQNRSYFANLAETGERSASAHFIIGYDGEIIQCIPLEEKAYAVKGRNDDSVSIECCYLSEDGVFTPSTYNSLIELLSWLCEEYELSPADILRHYDEGGKKCPLYYVEHEDEWEQLRNDVAQIMEDADAE